jgi:hypothetical protein
MPSPSSAAPAAASAPARKDSLLNRKVMDGPVVPWTVADLFRSNPNLYMAYHTAGSGFDFMVPVGTLVGGGLYAIGAYKPFPTALSSMAAAGLYAGGFGAAMGLGLLANAARRGEQNQPLPWNEDTIQMRVNGLSHNFAVRVMDLSVWSGVGVAAGVLLLKGGPAAFSSAAFGRGAFGALQILSLGAAAGGLSGIACVSVAKRKEKAELDKMDD